MNDKPKKIKGKILAVFKNKKKTTIIAGCAAVVFIAAACFPAIAAHQINLSSESRKTEEQITAEGTSISGDNPADQGNAGVKLSDTEPCAPDVRPSEIQVAKESIAAAYCAVFATPFHAPLLQRSMADCHVAMRVALIARGAQAPLLANTAGYALSRCACALTRRLQYG